MRKSRKIPRKLVYSVTSIWVVLILNNLLLVYFAPPRESDWRKFESDRNEELSAKWALPQMGDWKPLFEPALDEKGVGFTGGILGMVGGKLISIDAGSGQINELAAIEDDEKPLRLAINSAGRFAILWTEGNTGRPRLRLYDAFSGNWVLFTHDREKYPWAEIETAFPRKYYREGKYYPLKDRFYISQFDVHLDEKGDYIQSYYYVFDLQNGEFSGFGGVFNDEAVYHLSDISEDKQNATFTVGGDYINNPIRPDLESFIKEYSLNTTDKQFAESTPVNLPTNTITGMAFGPEGEYLLYERDCACRDTPFIAWLYRDGKVRLLHKQKDTEHLKLSDETFFDKWETVVLRIEDRDEKKPAKVNNKLMWLDYSGEAEGIIFETDLPDILGFNYLPAPDAGVLCYPTGTRKYESGVDGEGKIYLTLEFYDMAKRQKAGTLEVPFEIKVPALFLNAGDPFPKEGEIVKSSDYKYPPKSSSTFSIDMA
jgi:hypothetical protein